MGGGGEQIEGGEPRVRAAAQQRPPEEHAGAEEAHVLDRVNRLVVERGLVERRHVPRPQRDAERERRDRRPRDQRAQTVESRRAPPPGHPAATSAREDAERDGHGTGDGKQRRRHDHQELMLDHVRPEQRVGPPLEGGQQSHAESAAGERERSDAARGRDRAAAARGTDDVEERSGEDRGERQGVHGVQSHVRRISVGTVIATMASRKSRLRPAPDSARK